MSADASQPGDGTRSAEFDHRMASLTFDALEKIIIQATRAGEIDVAAEYLDALFLLSQQLDEFHEEYRSESKRLAERNVEIYDEENALQRSIIQIRQWAIQTDHPVAEWFNGGESA